ncbi:MAG: GNAT family N-acetyltransferase [Flavobacteriales bacterium]|nr:GNAT family N-acetyltransferase [Flavobacteriales bacterium]
MNTIVLEQFPRLESERLRFEQLIDVNLEQMLEITSFNGRATTHAEVVKLLGEIEIHRNNKAGITWGIYLATELIGTIGFYRGFENEWGEVGYVIRENFRRKGYVTEALRTVLRFAFQKMQLKGVSAFTTDDNSPSMGVLCKFGFEKSEEFSGLHRKYMRVNEEQLK